jgi:SpoVK/Ycf46/Vps4 family AAA+-type ATPase
MFAEAIAHEMNLPLMVITPANIFNSHVGESEKSVREIFRQVEACPDGAILFIDECESIFGTRSGDTPDWKASVTTELLQRLNGFGVDGSKRVLIGATNRPDLIDIAFLRYKRFTHQIHIQPPDDIAIRALIISALSKLNINNESAEKVEEVRDGQKYVYLKNQEKILEDITVEEIVNMATRGLPSNDSFGSSPVKSGSYSAADIRGIIEEVCRMAIEEIQAEQEAHPEKEVKAKKLRRDMFIKAFKKIPPSISDALLKKYTDFRRADNGSNLAGDKK